ncbi:cytochrome P450 family protein [Ceratobasidium sp. AG-Ba]|nr:cytochrome P450 family protein [Ceratobasidium sp. AG-Ba]
MVNDERLVGWGKDTAFLPYGERWKRQRIITQEVLDPSAAGELYSKMIKQVRLSMQRLLHNPEGIAHEIRWMIASILLSSVYGYEASYPHDDLVKLVETSVDHMCEAGVPGNFFVNTLPWLIHVPSWFPGAGWKRKANEWRAEKDRVVNEPLEWTKSQMASNKASYSISKALLTKLVTDEVPKNRIEEEEDIIRWVTTTLYSAGSDSETSTETSFILAMILYPEVQRKAQAELDNVLGGRLPELTDREALPYVNAVMKEVMRWRPAVPMGVAHSTTQDDVYRGFFIPKGTIVSMNVWSIGRDPKIYPNPEDFNPDRYLDPNLPLSPVFSLGRRDCPGAHFAQSSMFLMMSTFLTIFNVTATPGKPFPEPKVRNNVLVAHPMPFDCTVTPRSEDRRRLIEQWVDF